MSSQSFSCFVFCFPVSHRSDLPPVLPQERPSSPRQAPLPLEPTESPAARPAASLGCWQLTGCRGTLPSPILPFRAQMRCCGVREPPAESAEIPEAPPPPSVDGVTEPLGPLEASSGEHSASFSSLHKPATLLHCFPFIGTPSLFDYFTSDGMCMLLFANHVESGRSKMSNSKPSKPSSCFNSSEPCTADGMVARSFAVSKAWCGARQELLTASRQPASSIMRCLH